jgi:hypothetical protein
MGHRKKSFAEKLAEHERLKAAAHKVIDQMTRIELHRFFIRRKHHLQQQSPEVNAATEKQR